MGSLIKTHQRLPITLRVRSNSFHLGSGLGPPSLTSSLTILSPQIQYHHRHFFFCCLNLPNSFCTSGPLHMFFPLPGSLFFDIFAWLAPSGHSDVGLPSPRSLSPLSISLPSGCLLKSELVLAVCFLVHCLSP